MMEKADRTLLEKYQDGEKEIHAYRELLEPEDPLRQYLRAITEVPALSTEEEQALVAADSEEARTRLIDTNLRYAVIAALWCKGCGIQTIDLIQEANEAVVKAVQTYRPASQTRLSLHVIRTIQKTLSRVVQVQQQRQIVQRRAQMHERLAETFAPPFRKQRILSEEQLHSIGPVKPGEVVLVDWEDETITADFRDAKSVWNQSVETVPAELMEILSLPGMGNNAIRQFREEVLVVTDADLLDNTPVGQQWVAEAIETNLNRKGFVLAGAGVATGLLILRDLLGQQIRLIHLKSWDKGHNPACLI